MQETNLSPNCLQFDCWDSQLLDWDRVSLFFIFMLFHSDVSKGMYNTRYEDVFMMVSTLFVEVSFQ